MKSFKVYGFVVLLFLTNSVFSQDFNIAITPTPVKCKGANDGSLNLTVTGNTLGSFTYAWTGPNGFASSQQNPSGLEPGTYHVTVTRTPGDTRSGEAVIVESAAPLTLSVVDAESRQVSCNGFPTGNIVLSAAGGTANQTTPYLFAASPNGMPFNYIDNDGIFSTLSAGIYDFAVRDNFGCVVIIEDVAVVQPDPIAISIERRFPTCENETDGELKATVTGGVGGYTYTWKNENGTVVSTSSQATQLSEGSYSLQVTDANGCEGPTTSPVLYNGFFISSSKQDVSCRGLNDGSISLVLEFDEIRTQNTASVRWTRGNEALADYDDDLAIAGLAPGTYTATVRDNFGCDNTVEVEITEPEKILAIVSTTTDDVICKGDASGVITATVEGGTAGYSMTVVGTNTGATGTGSVGPASDPIVVGGLPADVYTVTVTDSKGCATLKSNVVVDEPPTFFDLETAGNFNITPVTCNGAGDGRIEFFYAPASDAGHPVKEIRWYKDGQLIATEDNANVRILSNLTGGVYSLEVEDEFGCVRSRNNIAVFEPLALQFVPAISNIKCPTDVAGHEGSIAVTVSGGNGGYAYQWKFGDNILAETSPALSGITESGVYDFKATDSKGCTKTAQYTVTIPDPLVITADEKVDIVCKGENTGRIKISVTGGTSPYTYTWHKDNIPVAPPQTSPEINNLVAGVYKVIVTDNNNCTPAEKEITIAEPATTYTITGTPAHVRCEGANDGKIDVTINADPGHPAQYTFSWVKDGAPFTDGQQDLIELSPGNYTLSVTDNFGCKKTETWEVDERPLITLNPSVLNNACPEDLSASVTITPQGGEGPYTIKWFKNNSVMPSETGTTISGLAAGEYRAEVTDTRGCASSSVSQITNPAPLSVVETISNIACRGETNGSISIVITGGTAPYNVSWEKNGAAFSTSTSLAALSAGSYHLTVTDSRNCTPLTRQFDVTEPSTSFEVAGTATDVVCNGANDGKINITLPLDGAHPTSWVFQWYRNGEAFGAGQKDLSNLSPGNYKIEVMDTYGCTKDASFTVVEFPPVSINASSTNNVCSESATATITIDPTGGKSDNYTYKWFKNGAPITPADPKSLSGLSKGLYKIIVTDTQSCDVEESIEITSPNPLNVVESIGHLKCRGDVNGSISLQLTGGTPPYAIVWEKNGEFVSDQAQISNLSSGTYNLTVTDGNNCLPLEKSYVVTEPATVYSLGGSVSNVTCANASDGEITLAISGEAGHPANYTIEWLKDGLSYANNVSAIKSLAAGAYTANVSDANGCLKTADFDLNNPLPIKINPAITPIVCNGADDAAIALAPTGGYGDFTAKWFLNDAALPETSFRLANIAAGKYSFVITDGGGCARDSSIYIDDPLPIIVKETISDVKCQGGQDGALKIEVQNGSTPFRFQWFSDGKAFSTSQNIENLKAGLYQVVVSDKYLCTSEIFEFRVNEPQTTFSIEAATQKVRCHNEVNGEIRPEITVTGTPGTFSFDWLKNGSLFAENTRNLIGIGSGTYTLVVEDQYGCIKNKAFVIENPTPIVVAETTTHVACFGYSTGEINLAASGGYGAYTYEWTKNQVSFQANGNNAANLSASDYIIKVTDAEGCFVKKPIVITQPPAFLVSYTKNDNTCSTPFDAEITVAVAGGVPGYTYQWFRNEIPFSDNRDIYALRAGTYELVVTDSNFCKVTTGPIQVTAPEKLLTQVTNMIDNLCPQTETGSIAIVGTGGSFPYLYALDSGAFDTKNNFFNLTGQDYLFSVMDAKNCRYDTLITVKNKYDLEAEFSINAPVKAIDYPIDLIDNSLGPGISEWLWDFGNSSVSSQQNTSVVYKSEGKYLLSLKVKNEVGCTALKTDTLTIEKGFTFTVPTAFSPNGDGLNDFFRPVFDNIVSLQTAVLDKNGVMVYNSATLEATWDGTFEGKDMPQGPYYYETTFEAKSGVIRKYSGKVFLFR